MKTVGHNKRSKETPMEQNSDSAISASESTTSSDWPRPRKGAGVDVAVTHLLIVRDVARSRHFYADVFDAHVLMEGVPSILRFYNTWLVLSEESATTDDKPDILAVELTPEE